MESTQTVFMGKCVTTPKWALAKTIYLCNRFYSKREKQDPPKRFHCHTHTLM